MNAETTFETHRPRLFGLSYRLLGSRSDAEDVVQDTWLRWQQTDRSGIRDAEAWLVTAATRLGIDRLRAARLQRERYTGPWLPEPAEIDESPTPEHSAEVAEQVSLAFLAVLERLGPEERAAFLLKEAFDYDYAQIAPLLGQSEANCRQMVHRARERVQAGRPRFDVAPENHRRLLERFMDAARRATSPRLPRCCARTRNWSPTAAARRKPSPVRCWAQCVSRACSGQRIGGRTRTSPGAWAGSMANRRSCATAMASWRP